jgi:hypothetical protein
MTEQWQYEAEMHRIYHEARSHRNAFWEKLALLDGGTVALVITAVLGPLHGTIKHSHLLGMGLTVLVAAMVVLLVRNLLAAQFEFHAAAETARDPVYTRDATTKRRTNDLSKKIYRMEQLGASASILGVVLLLIEVWLIL